MRSAVDFLPSSITLLMTCWTSLERWTGSGSSGRTPAAARRVRLLRGGGIDARADAPPLRRGHAPLAPLARLQARGGQLLGLRIAALADQLGGRRHSAAESSEGR